MDITVQPVGGGGDTTPPVTTGTFNRTTSKGKVYYDITLSADEPATCMLYIELNPVRAGMVDRPEAYRWSSYGFNAYGDKGRLQRHERYISLGANSDERCFSYRELFRTHLDGQEIHLIRQAAHYCQPVGDDRFRQEIENHYGIHVGQMRRGRPRKSG